jgi:hypothetical protein
VNIGCPDPGTALVPQRETDKPPEPEPWCVVSKEASTEDPYLEHRMRHTDIEAGALGIAIDDGIGGDHRDRCRGCKLPQNLTGKSWDVATATWVYRRCAYCGTEI